MLVKDEPDNSAPHTPQTQNGRKLRRRLRYAIDVRAVVTTQRDGRILPIHGRCTMVGELGFGATLAGELEKGARVEAELMLFGHTEPPLQASAIVRYRHGFRHGFEFVDLGQEPRQRVRELCHSLVPAN